jgi:RimJ/RimL family protein N-acetyltransferase
MKHFEVFAAFVRSEHSRFIGGPSDEREARDDAWWSVTSHAGQWTLRGYGTFWVSETATGAPVGRVGLYHPSWLPEPELAWVIYEDVTRRGFAVEAARAARDWAASQGLGPLWSLIDPQNAASEGVARRLSAVREGTHAYQSGKVVDVWRHPLGQAA